MSSGIVILTECRVHVWILSCDHYIAYPVAIIGKEWAGEEGGGGIISNLCRSELRS